MPVNIEQLVKDIETGDNPVGSAIFITGVMAGLICKHSGSSKYAALLRMIVALDDDDERQDASEIDRLMDKLRERFVAD